MARESITAGVSRRETQKEITAMPRRTKVTATLERCAAELLEHSLALEKQHSDDPDQNFALGEAIPVLVALLATKRKAAANASMALLHVCRAPSCWTWGMDPVGQMVDHGIIANLLRLLQPISCAAEAEPVQNAVQLLAWLLDKRTSSRHGEKIWAQVRGAAVEVVPLLQSPATPSELVQDCLNFLHATIPCSSDNREYTQSFIRDFVDAGAVEALVAVEGIAPWLVLDTLYDLITREISCSTSPYYGCGLPTRARDEVIRGAMPMLLARLDDVRSDVAEHASNVLGLLCEDVTMRGGVNLTDKLRRSLVQAGALPHLYKALKGGVGDSRADNCYECLYAIAESCPKETLAAARLAAQAYRRKDTFFALVGDSGPLIECLRDEARKQLRAAEGGESAKALLAAIEVAQEVGVSRFTLESARRRHEELTLEGERQTRLTELGVGTSVITYPKDFVCPITLSKFVDPVVASDGNSYEREAILPVLRGDIDACRSPLTREQLDPDIIVPNHSLRKRIRDYEAELVAVAEAARRAHAEELKRAAADEAEAGTPGGPRTSHSSRKRAKA